MTYTLDLELFSKFRKTLLLRIVPLIMLPMIAVLVFTKTENTTLLILIPTFIAVLIYTLRNTIKKQRIAWETFELMIDDQKIERTQQGFPSISVDKNAIKYAIEGANGSLTLVTSPRANSIIIPFSVENKIQLKEEISTFAELRQSTKDRSMYLLFGMAILVIALLFSFMMTTNIYLSISTGLTLLGLMIWGFVEAQRSKRIDRKVKRSSYVSFILVIVIVIRLFAVITEHIS